MENDVAKGRSMTMDMNCTLENGLRNGDGTCLNEDGRVVFVGERSDGMRNGVGREVNGNEESLLCHWKDGKKDGIALERDENGEIKRIYV